MSDLKILAVDDDELVLGLLEKMLTRLDIDCVTVSSANEAMKLMEDGAFSTVITDIAMPGIDGVTFIKHARSKYPGIKIVAMTAGLSNISPADQMADHTLLKPFSKEDIEEMLAACA